MTFMVPSEHPLHVGARGCILRFVVEVSRSRVLVADSRGADRHLRVTWHADTSTIVSVIGPGGYAGRRPPWHRLILSKSPTCL
jgi:hypothetical protein